MNAQNRFQRYIYAGARVCGLTSQNTCTSGIFFRILGFCFVKNTFEMRMEINVKNAYAQMRLTFSNGV